MIDSASNASQVYTDLNALQDIRSLGKENQSEALKAVAKQFESMFIGMMLSSMRQANDVMSEDSLFNSPEQKFYQSMFDDQLSLTLTGGKGTGLADVIYRQMMQQYDLSEEKPELNHDLLHQRRGIAPSILQTINDEKIRDTAPISEIIDSESNSYSAGEPQFNIIGGLKQYTKIESPKSSTHKNMTQSASDTVEDTSANKGQLFATPSEFIAALYPHAQRAAEQLGVDVKGILSQAALETGWGKFVIHNNNESSYNLFGIKANKHWKGSQVEVMTHEYRDGVRLNQRDTFRAYKNIENSLDDYTQFLSESQRYQSVLTQNPDASQYGFLLQKAGYATDPEYGQKIARIANSETMNSALKDLKQNTISANQLTVNPSGSREVPNG